MAYVTFCELLQSEAPDIPVSRKRDNIGLHELLDGETEQVRVDDMQQAFSVRHAETQKIMFWAVWTGKRYRRATYREEQIFFNILVERNHDDL